MTPPSGPRRAPDRHVVLLGMMGAGKTTTGRALAERLDRPLRDCDADLEGRTGRSGAHIAASDGVEVLHDLEETVLLDALASDEPAVVTGAGWVVESARCRAALRDGPLVVWLDVPVADLLERMGTGGHRRPLARPDAEALLARRRTWFAELADLHLDARAPTAELVDTIAAALAGGPAPSPPPESHRR